MEPGSAIGGGFMSELMHDTGEAGFSGDSDAMTDEDALRLADALAGRSVAEAEARCRVLAQFIADCERAGSRAAGLTEAVLELRALQVRRSGLLARRELIRQALECAVGDAPQAAALVPGSRPAAVGRRQRQVQIQVRRR